MPFDFCEKDFFSHILITLVIIDNNWGVHVLSVYKHHEIISWTILDPNLGLSWCIL